MTDNPAITRQLAAIAAHFSGITDAVTVLGLLLTPETPFPTPAGNFVPVNFKGVNIAGGENQYPASSQYNYIYPQNSELDYFAAKGFGLIRMPLSARRLQPASYGPLDPADRTDEPAISGSTPGTQVNLVNIKRVLDYAFTKGMYVVFDPHDYGYIADTKTKTNRLIGRDPEGTAQFCDLWTRIATKFMHYPNAIFGLMNEPHDQTAAEWFTGATAAINAIAAVTKLQWVLIPGTSWSGGHSWVQSGNAAAWAGYKPPAGLKTAFDLHQYLDSDSSGSHAVCSFDAAASMVGATTWARTNSVKLFVGEVGWSQDASCPPLASSFMAYLKANKDVYLGWSYWVGGSAAFYGSYMFTAQPINGVDQPQIGILTANL